MARGCMRERQKKVKLKLARDVHNAKDVFAEDKNRALECAQGDRVTTAHIRHFESATEEMVHKIWGTHASTSRIVQNWENFILGQLLDATHQLSLKDLESSSADLETIPCETCMRGTAKFFANSIQITRISRESAESTPSSSRTGTPQPDQTLRKRCGDRESTVADNKNGRRMSKPLRIWALNTVDLQIYVTSAYIHLLRSSPSSICENTPSSYTNLYLNFTPSEQSPFPPSINPIQHLSVYTLLLDKDSRSLLNAANAGGSSLESEVLSFEVLRRIMPYWELSTMEMSTRYASAGPITDYVARSYIANREISVSVTRVFGWSSNMKISKASLTPLLIRKLAGLNSATARILPRKNRGKILFVWVPDGRVEKNVRYVWNKLRCEDEDFSNSTEAARSTRTRSAYDVVYEAGITQNVIVFVCVCKKESWLDTRGWKHVFGKRDEMENQYLYALTGDQRYVYLPP